MELILGGGIRKAVSPQPLMEVPRWNLVSRRILERLRQQCRWLCAQASAQLADGKQIIRAGFKNGHLEGNVRVRLQPCRKTPGKTGASAPEGTSVFARCVIARIFETSSSNFHDMSRAQGVIDKCAPVGELKANQIGAKRLLNDAFHETLLELSEVDRTIKYRIDDGPSVIPRARESGRVQGSGLADQLEHRVDAVRSLPLALDS